MMVDDFYDDIPYYTKEAADMPYAFSELSVDKQIFFRDFFNEIVDNRKQKLTLIDDLELIKSELEAIIAIVKK
tara:strand:+ start:876 stop:1094 length:219 start_codon:yes stop_codon:yes gene_type:complete